MNSNLRWFSLICLLALAPVAMADKTSTWPFASSSLYDVSNSNLIEVAAGVARLKLQAATVGDVDLTHFLDASVTREWLGVGPDVLLSLDQRADKTYEQQGILISRVLDGGEGGGNRWDSLKVVAYNARLDNAAGETTTNSPGLLLLDHMNSNWVNEVTGVAGVPLNNPKFTSKAKFGTAAGVFSPVSSSATAYDGPFVFANGMSLSFWINATNTTASYPIVAAFFNGSTLLAYLRCGGSVSGGGEVPNSLFFLNYTSSGSAQTPNGTFGASDVGVWRHIVVTYDPLLAVGSRTRFYKDGVELAKLSDNTSKTFPNTPQIRLGGRGTGQAINGIIDECSVWDKALTPAEVMALYRLPRSVAIQCRSSSSVEGIETKVFVGPDGTSASSYGGTILELQNSALFSRVDRYLQYRLLLLGQSDGLQTPYVDAVGVLGSRVSGFDNVIGDFYQAATITSLDILPAEPGTIGVGLNKKPNGGYYESGTFLSRTIDGGASVYWDVLNWARSSALAVTEPDLLGLWHMDGGWSDGSGHGYNGSNISDINFTSYAKLGSQSALFNGLSSSVDIVLGSNKVGAVEFWLNTPKASGGILDFGTGASVRFENRLIRAQGFAGSAPQIYVNGQENTAFLPMGWNHVAVVWPAALAFTNLTLAVGHAGSDYYEGALDDLALYSGVKDGGSIKSHYLVGGRDAAGNIRFQVRASDVYPIPDSVSFVGPGNSASAYFSSSGSGMPSDVWRKRYFQYKLILDGDGSVSPVVNSVYVNYSGAGAGILGDFAATNFWEGSFVNDQTRLLGAELSPYDLAYVPGLINADAVSAVSLEGLWHMDESSWPTGPSVLDASSFNRNGDPQGGAAPVASAKVGSMAGSFNGINQYVILQSITLEQFFTIQGWFQLSSSNRSAVVSRDDGRLILEVNGNGSATSAGALTLIVSDGSTRKVATAPGVGVNDGRWHHVAGVRDGSVAVLYLDGVRVASAYLGSMGPLGLGQISLARHSETGTFMAGYLDEVSLYSRALSDAEIISGIAVGANIVNAGKIVSKVFDAGGPAIWESIAWEENGPYGDALTSESSLVGLWSMNALQGTTVPDSSPRANNGVTQGSVSLASGVFSNALALTGAGGVVIPFAGSEEQAALTVEAWVRLTAVDDRVIFSRLNGTDGYELATDANGKPYLAVGGTVCIAPGGIRPGIWTHLAGTFDGTRLAFYENGVCVAATNAGSIGTLPANGYIGTSAGASRRVVGLIDQVAVHNRVLNSEEIVDHARAGKGTLRFQGRAGDDPSLAGIPFVGVGGATNTYFDVSSMASMVGSVPLGRYFQYQAFLTPELGGLAPRLMGVRIKQSRYPSDNPWVSPKVTTGAAFLGKLLTFSSIMAENTDAAVRYQITGDSTNWFWWNTAAVSWENVTGQGYGFASPISDINANIPNFARLFYDKNGGELRFRAYLHSGGNDQVAIDEVKTTYSEGRITVTAPNGAETNKNALLTGVPFTIRWSSSGKVSNQLKIEYSRDGGLTWPTIVASNVVNSTNGYTWVLPAAITDQGLIRITDQQDATVSDTSDSMFQLVQRFRVLAPNGGEYWLTGANNTIRWASAVFLGNKAKITYAADGVNFNTLISPPIVGTDNTEGSVSNTLAWTPAADDPTLPSEIGRVRIETPGGSGPDESDEVFTLAGLAFSNPNASSYVNRGGLMNIAWTSAGAGTNVAFDYSSDNGVSWTNILASVPNKAGTNIYQWTVGVSPSDYARMRCRSLSGNTNLVGISQKFIVADVQVITPDATSVWQAGSTNTIVWVAGGVGNQVNLYYSTNSGSAGGWIPIPGGYHYANVSGSNTFRWGVPPYPGDKAQVKVEAVIDTNNLWSASPNFRIAGVRILSPNGGELWTMGANNPINWTYESAGSDGTIYFAYDGLAFETFPGGQRGLIDRQTTFTPITPTAHAKVKIVANNPAPFTDMYDISDDYFIVGGIKVTAPTNGVLFTVGTAGNRISWTSAGALETGGDGFASIYYTTDNGVTSNFIARVGNNENYPGGNSYLWNMASDVIPSESARILVRSGGYQGYSEQFLLRGIKITSPLAVSVVDLGATVPIDWVFAGLDSSAKGYFFLSTDGGATFPVLIPANSLNNAQGPWSINTHPFTWTVPMSTLPSTNAVIKFVITESIVPGDIGYAVNSPLFTLRGLKFLTPNSASSWAHDSTNVVQVVGAVAGPYLSVYYSPNGVSYDLTRPVVLNATLNTGLNSLTWGVERYRTPSSNATLKAISLLATNVSEPFNIKGIQVTSPQNTSIWAVGDSNTVSWVANGTTIPYTVELLKPGNVVIPIASGVTGDSIGWTVVPGTEGTNLVIRVRDSAGYYGDSGPFRITAEPTVVVVSPAAGDLWRVSDTYQIQWARGGQMSNNFTVTYTTSPFSTTNVIFSGVAQYDPILNLFSIPWEVPDSLGNTHIMVRNNIRGDIQGEQQNFRIVGKFTLIYPNGGEDTIYALKPETVSWYTMGSVNAVNLYYSTDPLHGTGSWVRINTSIANPGRGTEPSSYSWTPPKLESETVRLRVEQSNEPGAYDDSDRDFAIRFYEIIWHVYDSATSNNLDQLSVSDTSGWSEGSQISPVKHRYPYGSFDTVWTREYFFNNVTLKWSAEPSRTIDVSMRRSDVEPDYTVMANFVYDPTNAIYRVNSWLQRRGQVVAKPSKCTISVYDAAGGLMTPQLVSVQPDANGVFWQTLMDTLQRGSVYFVKVEIEFSAVVYSSGLTFNLRIPTDSEQAQQMLNMLTNIQDTVTRVDTNLTDLATAQAIFRSGAMAKLDSLTNSAEVIKAGITNLEGKVDLLATQTITRLDALTNAVGVIGPGETNLLDLVRNLPTAIGSAQREPRILTRPTTVKFGSSVNMLYRSLAGLTATWKVYPVGSASPVATGAMGGGVGGVYEADLTASWGIGDYQVECSDSAGSSDKMILKVARLEVDDIATTMGDVSNQLARVEWTLTNLSQSVSTIEGLVAGTATNIFSVMDVVDQLAQLTNMNSQVAVMTNAIAQVAGLTNLPAQMNYLTNVIEKVAGVTNIGPQMASVTNLMVQLAPLTNFGPQLNYVTNIVGQLSGITNISAQVAQMVDAVGRVAGVTNLIPQVAFLTNAVGPLAGLTNLPTQMAGVVAAVGQLGSLTNLGAQVVQMEAAISQIVALTNMAGQVDTLTAMVGQISSVTNLAPRMDQMGATLGQLVVLTNMPAQMNGVVAAINQLGGLTNLGGTVDQLVGAMGQIAGLTNMASQMNQVVAAVNQLGSLTNLGGTAEQLVGAMGQIAGLTNMASQMNQVVAAVNQLGSLTNLGGTVDQLVGAMGQIVGLTNMASQMNALTVSMGRISTLTNLTGKVDSVLATVNQLGSLTNLGTQVSLLTSSMSQIAGLTNMAGQVNALTTTMGQVATLTNLTGKVDSVLSIVSQLGSLTNLGAQVGQVTAAMGQIAGLTNMSGQVNAIADAVAALGSITNVNAKVDQLTSSVGQLSVLTNVIQQVDDISATIGQLSSLTNLGPQVDQLTGAMGKIAGLTNMSAQVDGVVADLTQLSSAMTSMSNTLASLYVTINEIQRGSNTVSDASALAPIISNTVTAVSAMAPMVSSIQDGIGAKEDAATANTVFGRLAALEQNVSAVGGATAQAVSRAGGARSQANAAAGAAARIKKEVASGQIPKVMDDLMVIRKALESTLDQVKAVPGGMSTEEMAKAINDAANTIKKVADSRGISTPLGQGPSGPVQAGSLNDPKAMADLLNRLSETKAMMEATRMLMDEAINKPVVVDWLEGTK